jgi:hypothetical protein
MSHDSIYNEILDAIVQKLPLLDTAEYTALNATQPMNLFLIY